MTGLAAGTINAPSISYSGLAPVLIVLGVACAGVLVEAFVGRDLRHNTQLVLAVAGLAGALAAVIKVAGRGQLTASGAVAIDGVTLFLQGTLVVIGLMAILLLAERRVDIGGGTMVAQAALVAGSPGDRLLRTAPHMQTEAFPLAMFALGGMMLFPAANNLLLMFVALEVLSLPLYLLAGLARRRRLLSQEAAVKYFLLGAFASAFFLYGVALLYGYANSVNLADILAASAGSPRSDILLYLGLALLMVGLLFKAGVAPFHSWTPDVYQGAPTPVTALMAACTKIAAFGAIVRVLYVAFNNTAWDWRPVVWTVAIITMAVGAIFGLTQTDLKRMLAYSSIAHAGFLLTGLISLDRRGLAAVLFYLASYGFATLGAFAVITLVRDADGEATHLSQWSGLARRSPAVAAAFTLFLLTFAGIPLTSGFIGKFVVFRAAWTSAGPLVVVALLASAVAAFFYLRVIVMMYFSEPAESGPTVAVPSVWTTVAVGVSAAMTVLLGILPQGVLELADKAAYLVG
ncbi:MAG: NADH-quinone oxidoreductase subunit NuoN [Actinobacteria bacterium]|nr:NADH-quinone oxidoreductase subunit NuoN [Actinomycetota bacterium]MBI3686846.1 NADH-quinone oxidoreductase subunit NuoN [Actinomycetota bacterium]